MADNLREAALEYHRYPTPGKISVTPTKAMATQRDLALAYSPGVADACMEIARDPAEAMNLTSRANLVAVVTNGTAVLGLGNIGPLAGKPVMEGKGCLFKKFAGIDVFDIELAENDPDALIETIARMEPTFGGINLEDIKAPECFYIETKLRERMKIPVFHDDQHGTAIVAAAAILNALKHVGKDIAEVKLVASGAGAAALACLDLIVSLGLRCENILVSDSEGVVYVGRTEQMDPNKARYAQQTPARTLAEIIARRRRLPRPVGRRRAQARDGQGHGARPDHPGDGQPDAGNPAGGGARRCAPTPSSAPAARTIRTRSTTSCVSRSSSAARSTCGATTINEEMKLAAVRAIAELAHAEIPEVGGAGLRRRRPALRPRVPDPQALRSAPDRGRGAGRRPGGDGQRRGDAARSPTWRPTASA